MGKLWKDERRFLHEKLRVLGMTYMGSEQKKMEKRIMVRDFSKTHHFANTHNFEYLNLIV